MTYPNASGACEPQTAYSFKISYPPKKESVLKPCPFCGGDVELRDKFDKDETAYILCTKCRMLFVKFDWGTYSEKRIIEEWNTRKGIDDVLRDIERLIADMPYDGMSDQEMMDEISRNRNRLLEGLRKGMDIERIYRQIKGE